MPNSSDAKRVRERHPELGSRLDELLRESQTSTRVGSHPCRDLLHLREQHLDARRHLGQLRLEPLGVRPVARLALLREEVVDGLAVLLDGGDAANVEISLEAGGGVLLAAALDAEVDAARRRAA